MLVSGLTVMTAMAGMFLSGDKEFIGMGLGAMIVVGVAMVGSLTVPAGDALVAGRPRREGPRAVRGAPPHQERRRVADVDRDHRPRAAASGGVGGRCARPFWLRSRFPPSA